MADIRSMVGLVVGVIVLLVARDFAFAPSSSGDVSAESSHHKPGAEQTLKERQQHVPKPNINLNLGPVLHFSFCYSWGYRKVFEQYQQLLSQRYPALRIEGTNYPPGPLNLGLAQALSVLKMVFLIAIATGRNPFEMLGLNTPQFFAWALNNKIYACMMLFFMSNLIEGQLLSTGAFEITFNDIPVWSKLQSGRIPEPAEVFQILDGQMKLSFGTGGAAAGVPNDDGARSGFESFDL